MNSNRQAAVPNLMILTSCEAIQDLAPVLQAFAARCGQLGAMHWLQYFLEKGVASHRVPALVLLLQPEKEQGHSLRAEDLIGAALFFEYRIWGLSANVYSTGDACGFDRILAPIGDRTEVASIALRALVQRGAHIALATYEGHRATKPQEMLQNLPNLQAASRQRTVERSFKLAPTLEGTLARLGKHTRSNLRYYRRRLEREMRVTFVAEAAPLLEGANLEALNAASLNPVPAAEFERRVRSACTMPGSFLCGLQGPDGRWISLVGGWRQKGVTVLHWQMNAAGFEKQSITTVMRSFLLEAEVARGTEELVIYGGTQHSMSHAFERQPVADLIVRRTGLKTAALCCLARLFVKPKGLLGRSNFFACTLLDRELEWVPAGPFRPLDVLEEIKTRQFSSLA